MAEILTTDPQKLIFSLAQELKKNKLVQSLDWAVFVKTGHHKERSPDDPDWWYARSAAILVSIYRLGPVGTHKLRTKYGGKKNRGHRPERFFKASGSIIRKILQQLEQNGLIKQTEKGIHKGRIITPKGEAFLNNVAKSLGGELAGSERSKKDKKEGKKEEVKEKEGAKEKGKEVIKKEIIKKEVIKKEYGAADKRIEEPATKANEEEDKSTIEEKSTEEKPAEEPKEEVLKKD